MPLYSALLRPHLGCCNQLWGAKRRKAVHLLDSQKLSERWSTSPTSDRAWVAQPGDEEIPGRPHCSLSILKGGTEEGWVQTF